MNDETSIAELEFRPDFAADVVDQANKIVRRRRWRALGSSIAAAAILAVGLWNVQSLRSLISRGPTPITQIANASEFSWTDEAGQSDPLQWMFPDAQPVAQFSNVYSDALIGNAGRRQRLLFADDMDRNDPL